MIPNCFSGPPASSWRLAWRTAPANRVAATSRETTSTVRLALRDIKIPAGRIVISISTLNLHHVKGPRRLLGQQQRLGHIENRDAAAGAALQGAVVGVAMEDGAGPEAVADVGQARAAQEGE